MTPARKTGENSAVATCPYCGRALRMIFLPNMVRTFERCRHFVQVIQTAQQIEVEYVGHIPNASGGGL